LDLFLLISQLVSPASGYSKLPRPQKQRLSAFPFN